MSDLVGNHIVGFPTRRLNYKVEANEGKGAKEISDMTLSTWIRCRDDCLSTVDIAEQAHYVTT